MASIQKRDNGRWRARYRDDAGKEHARHFDRKVDAQRWLDEVTASVVTGQYVDPRAGRMTFDAWFSTWSEQQVWASMTQVQADLVRRTVTFGSVPLSQLRESHLQAWVKHMSANDYAANTIHTRVMPVRAALRAAVRERRIATDPSAGITLPRRANRSTSLQVATHAEVGRLLAASEPRMQAFVAVCAFAGLRLGEAAGLQVDDIDFLRRRLHVSRQVQKRRGGPSELKAPKYESARAVFLSDELLQLLAAHVEHHVTGPGRFLFTGSTNQPIPPTTVHHWWMRLCQRAEVGRLTIHGLRHYFASGLIASGCDVVTVQRSLGHKSPSVTLDTYSHLWPTAEDQTRRASGQLFAEAIAAAADSPRTATPDTASDLG